MMAPVEAHVEFEDMDSGSPAFVTIRTIGRTVVIGLGVEANGDLDLVVSGDAAQRIAAALADAAEAASQ